VKIILRNGEPCELLRTIRIGKLGIAFRENRDAFEDAVALAVVDKIGPD